MKKCLHLFTMYLFIICRKKQRRGGGGTLIVQTTGCYGNALKFVNLASGCLHRNNRSRHIELGIVLLTEVDLQTTYGVTL